LTLERKAARLEDPGAHLLDAVSSFGTRYGRGILIGLGVIAVVAAGAFLTLRSRAAAEEAAAGRLAEGNILFWQGDYNRSLQIAKQVTEQWSSTPSGVDALRVAGDDQFWIGNFKEAISEYRRYLERRKAGLVADAVRRSLAYALENDHQFKEAASAFEGLVGRFDRESSAEFLFSSARCYRLLSQPKDAERALQRLLDEYGETSYANRARIVKAELAAAPH
jgi:tetratricopeptide (TPR) repeat protein